MNDPLQAVALIIVLGIGAQWLAWRLKVASILLLLIAGILIGPVTELFWGEGTKLLDPDRVFGDLLLPFVSLSVGLILYEGGLTLRFVELREAGAFVWRLVTVGAMITWVLAALAASLILGLPPQLATLLGAVLVVTGPTVIVPLLQEIRPTGRIGAILKWEGIVIDPIGAILAVLVFEAILIGRVDEAAPEIAWTIVKTLAVGFGLGITVGLLLALLLRLFLVPDFLENAVSLMFVIGAYAAAEAIQHESGLLVATVMGITLANQRLVDVKHIVEFKENLRVLLISGLFILLAARLNVDDLRTLGLPAIGFLVVLIVLVRPISVFCSTLGLNLARNEYAFLSIMAPRGIVAAAVSSVFALRLAEETGVPNSQMIVPVTFLVIIGTVLFSSLTAKPMARKLGLADPNPQGVLFIGAHAWARLLAEELTEHGFRVLLVDTNRNNLAAARMAGLDTYAESVLAEHALDEMNLGGLGKLIAATPNDWVNVLSVQRMVRIFGRSEVYQVAPAEKKKRAEERDTHRHLHGRWFADERATYGRLAGMASRGAVVKATRITEEFTLESFREMYGDKAVPMFIVTDDKRLVVITEGGTLTPKSRDTLISLVEADAEAETPKRQDAETPKSE